jgi:calcineurin-like phosphoesterase family protein
MGIYFTADLHLGEESVMLRCERPWNSIEAHDAALIANINEWVGADDELYILGDFTGVSDANDYRPVSIDEVHRFFAM